MPTTAIPTDMRIGAPDKPGPLRARLAELSALEKDLKALRDRCDGTDALCHTIEALHEKADALPVQGTRLVSVRLHV